MAMRVQCCTSYLLREQLEILSPTLRLYLTAPVRTGRADEYMEGETCRTFNGRVARISQQRATQNDARDTEVDH